MILIDKRENTEWDNLVDEYSSLTSLSERKEKADDLKLFLHENEPIMPIFTLQDSYLVHDSLLEYDEVLLSIGALEWEKLIIDVPELEDGKAGFELISFLLGMILLPVIKKIKNNRRK